MKRWLFALLLLAFGIAGNAAVKIPAAAVAGLATFQLVCVDDQATGYGIEGAFFQDSRRFAFVRRAAAN